MSRYKETDMKKVKTYSIRDRKSKVGIDAFAKPVEGDVTFKTFYASLPRFLSVNDLDTLVDKIIAARSKNKPVLLMMGAHVIKVGLNPLITDMLKKDILQGIAFNGACAIHDVELAYFGQTSEDVAASLKDGTFGMCRETALILNEAAVSAQKNGMGFGEALGKKITEDAPANTESSILYQAYQLKRPLTVHVALGSDIVHQHANADGAAIGEASLRDFRIFSHTVSGLNGGGVLLHFGSAVVMPEVFLKALTVARNVHGEVKAFTTANFDMIRQYRPMTNVVRRPVEKSGTGLDFTGHHEILLPLLAAALSMKLGK